jgi:hypothetical protein
VLRAALAITLLASGVKLTDVPFANELALGVLGIGLVALSGLGLARLTTAAPSPEGERP